ncbi:MAG: PTS sugar transporter subunit IIA, partial [Gammaproteobacteria bacterium]
MDVLPEDATDLGALIESSRVLCNVEARSKKHSLDILSELLATAVPDLSQGTVFDSLIQREKVGSTALEGGIAIPHGCLDGIDRIYGAFVKLSVPVDYDTVDGQPVDLLCGLLLPRGGEMECGHQLREFARIFHDPGLLAALRAATNSRGLFDLLAGQHPTQPARSASG